METNNRICLRRIFNIILLIISALTKTCWSSESKLYLGTVRELLEKASKEIGNLTPAGNELLGKYDSKSAIISSAENQLVKKISEVFIGELSTLNRCYIHITNFKNADIQIGSQLPVTLRQIQPAYFVTKSFWGKGRLSRRFVWVPKGHFQNGTTPNPKCSISSFFQNSHFSNDGLCSKLNFHNYTSQAKPWSCQIYMDLLPPTFLFQTETLFEEKVSKRSRRRKPLRNFGYPPVWNHRNLFSGGRSKEALLPSIAGLHARFIVFGNEILNISENDKTKILEIWVWNSLDKSTTISRNQLATSAVLFITTVESPVLQQIKFNDYCHKEKFLYMPVTTKNFLKNQWSLESNINYLQPENLCKFGNQYLQVQSSTFSNTDMEFERILKVIDHCNKPLDNGNRHNFWKLSLNERLAHAHVHIWTNIIKNYSYVTTDGKSMCSNAVKYDLNQSEIQTVHRSPFSLNVSPNLQLHLLNLPLQLPNYLKTLKFISCGNQNMEPISFRKLVNIFDKWTWLFINLVGLLLSFLFFFIHATHQDNSIFHQNGIVTLIGNAVLSAYKIFLEVGHPCHFLATKILSTKLRLILGLIMLLCVVISNAYKSKNVSGIISPRLPLQLENLEQLISKEYVIYTRSQTVHVPETMLHFQNITANDLVKSTSSHRRHFRKRVPEHSYGFTQKPTQPTNQNVSINSELSWLQLMSVINRGNNEQQKNISFLMNSTTLLSQDMVKNMLVESIQKVQKHNEKNQSVPIKKLFLEAEQAELFKRLKSCDNIAIILPLYLCNDYKAELEEPGVSISKEVFHVPSVSFYFTGYLMPAIIQRISSIHQSGIWAWWNELLLTRVKSKKSLQFLTISGVKIASNVQVIFYILLAGLLIGGVCFIIENIFKSHKKYNWFVISVSVLKLPFLKPLQIVLSCFRAFGLRSILYRADFREIDVYCQIRNIVRFPVRSYS